METCCAEVELRGTVVYVRRCGAKLCFVDILCSSSSSCSSLSTSSSSSTSSSPSSSSFRVELAVRCERVPKLLKLGDLVCARGRWEEEQKLHPPLVPILACDQVFFFPFLFISSFFHPSRFSQVPVVLEKFDSSVVQFVPIPGPARRKLVDDKTLHCRFWLSMRKCQRGETCRYLHTQDEKLFASEAKKMIVNLEAKKQNKVR